MDYSSIDFRYPASYMTPPPLEGTLREMFVEPPFTTLDQRSGFWQRRRKYWLGLGIQSELGRDAKTFNIEGWTKEKGKSGPETDTSVFDPVVCELMVRWFSPEGGWILDPFAGGSVRGIVSAALGRQYVGVEIRGEQIQSNVEQAARILGDRAPMYYQGNSATVIPHFGAGFDLVFSCPPYVFLEVYSDLPGDISALKTYPDFLTAYFQIISAACSKLKPGGFAAWIVGEVRAPGGAYYGFVPDTIRGFSLAGMEYYNEAVLINAAGTAPVRAKGNMKYRKLVKTHQNILVFRKPGG